MDDQVSLDMRNAADSNTLSRLVSAQKDVPVSLGALANAAYAITAFMSGCTNLGAIRGNITILLVVALVSGGLTQFICGEFKSFNIISIFLIEIRILRV